MEATATNKLGRFVQHLPETTIPFQRSQIKLAKEILASNDFPTTRNEAWKYTRTGKIASIEAQPFTNALTPSQLKAFVLDEAHHTIIFVNGQLGALFPSTIEVSKGLSIKLFSQCTASELEHIQLNAANNDVFDAINLLHLNEGLRISLEKNGVLRQPVVCIHLLTGTRNVHQTRLSVELGDHAQMVLIQQVLSISAENSFGNIKTDLNLSDGSSLEFFKLQLNINDNAIISRESATQSTNSKLTIHTHTAHSSFVRNDSNICVHGVNAETHLFGSYLLKAREHVDNHTCVDHRAPHCLSNELYKGVIGDKATGVFNGKVFVRQDAQKINAFQSNANILIGEFATINSKPELEIYADDVKCSHGSTTGQLDDEAIFYLKTRGISEKAAKDLLIQAFLDDVFSKTENAVVQHIVDDAVKSYFNTKN